MRKLKIVCLTILIVIANQNFSQEKSSQKNAKNELKIDALDLTFFTAIEISYERVKDNEIGYGISAFINPRKENTYFEKYAFTPFVRYYFTNKEDYGAKGYFVELFSKFASGNTALLDPFSDKENDYFDIALGLSIGRKWISHRGFVLETFWGAGRNFGIDSNSPGFVARGGVTLGYRF